MKWHWCVSWAHIMFTISLGLEMAGLDSTHKNELANEKLIMFALMIGHLKIFTDQFEKKLCVIYSATVEKCTILSSNIAHFILTIWCMHMPVHVQFYLCKSVKTNIPCFYWSLYLQVSGYKEKVLDRCTASPEESPSGNKHHPQTLDNSRWAALAFIVPRPEPY